MRSIIILISLLLPFDTGALASSNHLLTCEEFEYLSEGLRDVDNMDQSARVEILSEFIEATDPKCFS